MNNIKILDVYEAVKDAGHPDPVGFIARSELLSEMNPDYRKNGRIGISGIKEDLVTGQDSKDNLASAVALDLANYEKYGDVSNMHVAFESGDEAVEDRSKRPKSFLRKLSKQKKRVDKTLRELYANQANDKIDLFTAPEPEEMETSSDAYPDLVDSAGMPQVLGISSRPEEQPATEMETSGELSKIESLRGAFQSLRLPEAKMPASNKTEASTRLRKLIRKAIQNV